MKQIIMLLADRYKEILFNQIIEIPEKKEKFNDEWPRLLSMLNLLSCGEMYFPDDKSNRWIGFIQGCLFMMGVINIDEERKFTRDLFHDYYRKNGMLILESIDVEENH